MARYQRMNTAGLDDDNEETLKKKPKTKVKDEDDDDLINEDDLDSEDSDEDDEDDNEESKKSDKESSTKVADENQLAGMIAVVWALLIIGIIVFVAGTIVKHKNNTTVSKEYKDVASGLYPISSIATEDKSWTDYAVIQKQVQSNGNTVAFYLVGEAENYGKIVYIPVTLEEFNSVEDGNKIEFVFSRLNLESKENILIRRWNVCGS